MSYNADKPITSREGNDLLGRGYFSEQLGKLIYAYRVEDG